AGRPAVGGPGRRYRHPGAGGATRARHGVSPFRSRCAPPRPSGRDRPGRHRELSSGPEPANRDGSRGRGSSASDGVRARRAPVWRDHAARGCGARLLPRRPGPRGMTFSPSWCRLRGRAARIRAVSRIEVLHLVRDRTTISLTLLVPAIQLVLFGYAVNLDPKHIPIAVARAAPARARDRLRNTIEDTGYFSVLADGLPAGAAARMVADGRALAGVETPTLDYSDPDAPSTPKIAVDATAPAAVRPALAALQIAYWRRAARLDALDAGPAVDVEWLYNPDRRTAWTIVPGLAGRAAH